MTTPLVVLDVVGLTPRLLAHMPRLRALAARRLPEVERLIERATQMRAWLQSATRCECVTVDQCALFDDPALPASPGSRIAGVDA